MCCGTGPLTSNTKQMLVLIVLFQSGDRTYKQFKVAKSSLQINNNIIINNNNVVYKKAKSNMI